MQAIALEAIQGMTGGLLWLALLHALWIGLAAAGGVALAFQAGRPFAHRARHAGLLAALGLVVVGPPRPIGLAIPGRPAAARIYPDRSGRDVRRNGPAFGG